MDEDYNKHHNTVEWVRWLLDCTKEQAIAVIGHVIADKSATITGAFQQLYAQTPPKQPKVVDRRKLWGRI